MYCLSGPTLSPVVKILCHGEDKEDMVPKGRALSFLVFFMLYLLLGGYIFNAIECPEELAKNNLHLTSKDSRDSIKSKGPMHPMDSMSSKHSLKSMDSNGDCELWSFYNSVFFAFTSITTIGYGRTAPLTQLGRGVLLIYSFIGIPINGILIGTIGVFFSIKVSTVDLDAKPHTDLLAYSDTGYSDTVYRHLVRVTLFQIPSWPFL